MEYCVVMIIFRVLYHQTDHWYMPKLHHRQNSPHWVNKVSFGGLLEFKWHNNTINKSAQFIDYSIAFFYLEPFHTIIKSSFILSGSFIHRFHKAKQTRRDYCWEDSGKRNSSSFVKFYIDYWYLASYTWSLDVLSWWGKTKGFFGMFMFDNA